MALLRGGKRALVECNGAHPAFLLPQWITSESPGARNAATLAYEKVCSRAPNEAAAEPEKLTAMIVHGLLGSGYNHELQAMPHQLT